MKVCPKQEKMKIKITQFVQSEYCLISVREKIDNLKILGRRRWLADKWGVGLCNNSDINVSLLTFELNSARKAKVKSLWIQLSTPLNLSLPYTVRMSAQVCPGAPPKNLTLHMMKRICFSFYHYRGETRSFLTMLNTSFGRNGSKLNMEETEKTGPSPEIGGFTKQEHK